MIPSQTFQDFFMSGFLYLISGWHVHYGKRQPAPEKSKEGTAMLMEPDCCKSDLSSRCSVCGRAEKLFELPGRSERYCLGCSADLATATLLTAEIDAATLAGQNVSLLVSEFEQLGARILARSQSAELGSF
jgi:hypothetical protein